MINMVSIIEKKKNGLELSEEEIRGFVKGVTDGSIPDYQTSALLMAICLQGMNKQETFTLTDAMLHSGQTMDLTAIKGIKVDKHSTGGVGDKTSLIVAPIAASCGVPISKMSGRGLGFTGGTVDKMESIPGFRIQLSPEEFLHAVETSGMSIVGQTQDVAPADKKLYALRDVTATVNNISLISSSIMSKKLASGSDAIVLDVKCGHGSFNKTQEAADELGKYMVEIGTNAGKKVVAVITDMNQPLGDAVGNSVEVIEAINTLKCQGPADMTELALTLAGYMIYCGQKASTPEEGRAMAEDALKSGRALETLKKFIKAQGGDPTCVDDYSMFKQPKFTAELKAAEDGFITEIIADTIGLASQHLGAGRKTKEDAIDLSAGIILKKKVGAPVKAGDVIAVLYSDDEDKLAAGLKEAASAYSYGCEAPEIPALVKNVIQ
ncbi:MAG: thymidine phosphorylase [Clostridia bacterium]|nr:thymidine phosphorylase [Clostridia bacterium]